MRLPDAIYIGPDRAGSSWLFRLLRAHPQTYVPVGKDLYYFDREFHRGIDWYAQHFEHAAPGQVCLEICHDYIDSPIACRRIATLLPRAGIMATLREPVSRTISTYYYWLKQGLIDRDPRRGLAQHPEIISGSEYSSLLTPYLDDFPAEHVFLGLFDDLQEDPIKFARSALRFLGVSSDVPPEASAVERSRATSRSVTLTRIMKQGAVAVRAMGQPDLVGRMKHSPLIDRVLYRKARMGELPEFPADLAAELQEHFRPGVLALDEIVGQPVSQRWGYR